MKSRPEGSGRRAPYEARYPGALLEPDRMSERCDGEAQSPFMLSVPDLAGSGVVFSSPHSGRAYFESFVNSSRLSLHELRASEDAFVDCLFGCAAEFGAPLLAAIAPRAFVDLNRCPSDLDPSLLAGAGRRPSNARVAAGLGVVPRIVAEGVSIYDGKISLDQAMDRIRDWPQPYHQKLVELLEAARIRFGKALLIDCHSMPSAAVAQSRSRGAPVDVVLGDRFGASCGDGIVDEIEKAFIESGFRVERNAPFAGGYITERFGQPSVGVHAVQIEIDRGLYLDQSRVSPNDDFESVMLRLRPVIRRICDLVGGSSRPTQLAAE